jgi:hypothetical protein
MEFRNTQFPVTFNVPPVAVEPVNKVKILFVHQKMDDVQYNISIMNQFVTEL